MPDDGPDSALDPQAIPDVSTWHERGLNRLLDLEPFEVGDEGVATSGFTPSEEHTNPAGLVHGGALFGLIDATIAAAVLQTLEEGERMVTQSSTVDFLRPAEGHITATARVDRRGKLTAYATGEASDADGRLIARVSAVWAIRHDE